MQCGAMATNKEVVDLEIVLGWLNVESRMIA